MIVHFGLIKWMTSCNSACHSCFERLKKIFLTEIKTTTHTAWVSSSQAATFQLHWQLGVMWKPLSYIFSSLFLKWHDFTWVKTFISCMWILIACLLASLLKPLELLLPCYFPCSSQCWWAWGEGGIVGPGLQEFLSISSWAQEYRLKLIWNQGEDYGLRLCSSWFWCCL